MPFYTLATKPLIDRLTTDTPDLKQIWYAPQNCIPWCHSPSVWLAPIADPLKLCLWPSVLGATRPLLPQRRLPLNKAQWAARYHSITILKETCHGVATEPSLQPITSETFNRTTANRQNGARLDVVANGFWGSPFERAFFDVRVFNPFAPSNRHTSLSASYRHNENLKKRHYEQRIREVELVFYPPGQTPCQHALGQMEATIQHHHWLAKMQNIFLTTQILHLCAWEVPDLQSHPLNGHLAASVDLTIAESNISVWTLNT